MSKRFGVAEDSETEESARKKIVIAARKMLDGKLSFIEGSRSLVRLRFAANLERDADIMPFVAIDSETDAFPFGEVRAHWNSEALAARQPEIESAEQWAKDTGTAHCKSLIRRLA